MRAKLAGFWREVPDGRSKRDVAGQIDRAMPERFAGGILAKIIVALPIRGRANGSGDKPASTVRANVEQDQFNARGAERAFVTANAGLARIGRQGLLAVFAVRSEFEHDGDGVNASSWLSDPVKEREA
jgi:hypothetical protein